MEYEKQVELAKKLNELAKRGVGGEKTNAAAMLEKLMRKYNLKIEDFDHEQRKERRFKYQNKTKKLFIQICLKVIGSKVEFYKYRGEKGNYSIINCNEFEYIQIKEYYEFYSKLLTQELKRFEKAFIMKNNLIPDDAEKLDTSNLTKTELMELYQTIQMMDGITAKSPHRILPEFEN